MGLVGFLIVSWRRIPHPFDDVWRHALGDDCWLSHCEDATVFDWCGKASVFFFGQRIRFSFVQPFRMHASHSLLHSFCSWISPIFFRWLEVCLQAGFIPTFPCLTGSVFIDGDFPYISVIIANCMVDMIVALRKMLVVEPFQVYIVELRLWSFHFTTSGSCQLYRLWSLWCCLPFFIQAFWWHCDLQLMESLFEFILLLLWTKIF